MNDEQQRLQKILQGAFSGPPTPLVDIPTRSGESRQLRRPTDTPASSPTQRVGWVERSETHQIRAGKKSGEASPGFRFAHPSYAC
jgi:hypothetical protein